MNTSEELRAVLTNRAPQFVDDVKKQLRKLGSEYVDNRVAVVGPQIEASVDCTRCAACCKILEPELSQNDLNRLAEIENLSPEVFTQRRTEISNSGKVFLKSAPCRFLNCGACSIYSMRPESCADFPHLYRPHFLFRRLIWEHYSMCPIVFNVVEHLLEDFREGMQANFDFGNHGPSS